MSCRPPETWQEDKSWSDRHVTEVKRILGVVFFSIAPLHMDQKQNADLLVLQAGDMKIACRLRRAEKYIKRYPNEVTFRSSRDTGTETELEKMLSGFGDFMFYGFVDAQGRIVRWVILDLQAVRVFVGKEGFRKIPETRAGGQCFKAIDISKHMNCVHACSAVDILDWIEDQR